MEKYNHKKIEPKWQKEWFAKKIYEPDLKRAKKPFYNLMMFPYPSAEGLHIGNMYAFVGSDIYGRFKRMEGNKVFEPIGLDGFGIHSENYALKIGAHPMKQAKKSEKNFYRQLYMIGNGYAWNENLETYNPEYYKWTQWIFMQMFKAGLAYRKKSPVNWCLSCKTVLANEQVVSGECERCGTVVIKKDLEQWFFKITKYSENLLKDLDHIDWSEKVKIAQKNWIGESEGALINFKIKNDYLKTTKETWKFNPKLIPLVLSGKKYITYRTEKKKFKQGDICEFLDYATKKPFALAKITKIENKKLKDIPHDLEGHEKFKNRKDFYNTYSKYYKIKANDETEIWLFYFELVKNETEVFTTRPDTIFGATYLVLAPEHELIKNSKEKIENWQEIEKYINVSKNKTSEERQENKEKTGVELKGIKAINPANNEEIPIWISDYVLAGYGTGAIMAVPAHDERDFEFAKKFNLPVKMVICPNYPKPICPVLTEAYAGDGHLVGSGKFDGMKSEEAKQKITEFLGSKMQKNYRLRDWLISRQRYWGAPIPLIYCENCSGKIKNKNLHNQKGEKFSKGELENPGWIAVSEKDLPVKLPFIKNFRPTGTDKSPLASVKSFYETKCPKCGSKARRETDVSDTFLDSAWYYFRYIDVKNKKEIFNKNSAKKWLPVNMYIGGAEHSVLHLLYSRFITKVFKDLKLISFKEPFTKFRAHGLIIKNGTKMSKSKGNVINPDEYIKIFGADALRMYLMFLGHFDQGGDFRDEGIRGISRFLNRIWNLKISDKNTKPVPDNKQNTINLEKLLHQSIKKITEDIENLKYNTAISCLMILLNGLEENKESLDKKHYEIFLKLLSPFAPHITEELWWKLRNKNSIHVSDWPKYDKKKIKEETFELVVQINGKFRDSFSALININEEKAKKEALNREKIKNYLNSAEPKKIIFVPNKLINIVI